MCWEAFINDVRIERRKGLTISSTQFEHQLQGVPQFPPQLCVHISWSYVNITKYPFNHVISEAREFFWGMKHHGTCKDASEKCRMNFWLIFNFSDFFAQFWRLQANFGHSWQVARQWNEEFDFNNGIINDSSSCELISCHGRPKRRYKNSKQGKKSQILRISQKLLLQFSKASLHVPWCFIPQTKSPTYVIKWLEGYSEILTYVREISNQSCNTNHWTPCS